MSNLHVSLLDLIYVCLVACDHQPACGLASLYLGTISEDLVWPVQLCNFVLDYHSDVCWLHINVERGGVHKFGYFTLENDLSLVVTVLEGVLIAPLIALADVTLSIEDRSWSFVLLLLLNHIVIVFEHGVFFAFFRSLSLLFLLLYVVIPPILA